MCDDFNIVYRTELCRFSGQKIYPGRGIRFIRSDSQVFNVSICICGSIFALGLKLLICLFGFRFSCFWTRNARGTSTISWSPPSLHGLLCTESSTRKWEMIIECRMMLFLFKLFVVDVFIVADRILHKRLWRRGVVLPRSRIPGLLLEPLWKLSRRREVRNLKFVMPLGRLLYGMNDCALFWLFWSGRFGTHQNG